MGYTPNVFLRVRPTQGSSGSEYTRDSDGKTLSVRLSPNDASKQRSFYFDQVFDPESTEDDINERVIQSHILQFLDGFNVSLIMLGQTDSGKTFTLHGPKGRDFSNGLLPFTAQSLFETLEKRVSLNGYRYSGQDKLGIQIFEVYAELAKDLIEPSNDGLTVTLDDNEEPIVNGLTTRWFSNAYELNQIIQTSRANRVGDNSDSGDKSAVLYVFKMTRNEVSDNQAVKGGLVQSRMTIVDSCGAELFLKDPKKLVLREGLYVSKTVLALWNAVKDITMPKATSKFDLSSVINRLLFEEFGGNCISSFFVTLNPKDDMEDNLLMLNFIDLIRQVVNHPVRNDENFSLLKRKLRKKMKIEHQKQIDLVHSELVQSGKRDPLKETNNSEELDKLQSRLTDLNSKFNAMLQTKSRLESEMIKNVTEKLSLKKSLLDVQIDNNKLIEDSETRSMESTNKILALESEIMQMELKSNVLSKENFEIKKKWAALEDKNSTLDIELKSLESNYENVRKSYKKLLGRNEEMGLELISLLNVKDCLTTEKERIVSEMDKLQKHNEFLETSIKSYDQVLLEKGIEVQKLKQITFENNYMNHVKEQQNAADTQRKSTQESVATSEQVANLKKKEAEHHQAVQSYMERIRKLEQDKKLMETKLLGFDGTQKKPNQTSSEEFEALKQSYFVKERKWKDDAEKAESKLRAATSKYRDNLESYIRKIMNLSEKSNIDRMTLKVLKGHVDDMLKDMLQTYKKQGNASNTLMAQLQAQLKEYVQSTQAELERERLTLLTRCTIAEERLAHLEGASLGLSSDPLNNELTFQEMIPRSETFTRLLKSKTIGYFGGLCLLFNAMTGPGIPFTPNLFGVSGSGAFMAIASFAFFSLVSGFSVLLIIETMQAIPGNKHFQGTVEFGTLINFYFGNNAHYLGQLLLYGALQSNAIQSIVISSQNTDNLLIDVFGKTCGLSQTMGWICATVKSSDIPSPFQCTPMVFTLGYLVILILVVPMGIINLDDNIWVQMGSFLLAILIGLQWIVSAILTGPDPSRVPWFSSSPLGYGMTLGTVMLNLGFTTVVPSWINIKKKDVSAQKLVWTSVFAAFGYYTLLGAILALSYTPNISGTVLPDLMTQGVPVLLTKITVYMYSFVMLVTSIPVSCIVTYNNIVQNNVLPKHLAILCSFVLPWIFAIPLQTGIAMPIFITWCSLVFVSTANFIVPGAIYFSCLHFRRRYNENRELTDHQRALLKIIHWSSMTIHKFIDDGRPRPQIVIEEASRPSSPSIEEHAQEIIEPAEEDSRISPVELARGRPTIEISQPKDIETDLTTNDSYLDKLSPGTEPKLRRPTRSKSRNSVRFTDEPPSSIPSTPGSFLGITQQSAPMEPTFNWWVDENAEPIWLQEDVPDPDAEDLPRKISLTPSAIFNLRHTYSEHSGSPPKQTGPALNHYGSEANLLSVPSYQSDTGLGVIDNDFDSISSRHSTEEPRRSPSYNPNKGVHRAVSLPFNPDFVSPAFRSIPAWIPLRTVHVAAILVGTTVILSLANIVFSLYVLVTEPMPTCTPT